MVVSIKHQYCIQYFHLFLLINKYGVSYFSSANTLSSGPTIWPAPTSSTIGHKKTWARICSAVRSALWSPTWLVCKFSYTSVLWLILKTNWSLNQSDLLWYIWEGLNINQLKRVWLFPIVLDAHAINAFKIEKIKFCINGYSVYTFCNNFRVNKIFYSFL